MGCASVATFPTGLVSQGTSSVRCAEYVVWYGALPDSNFIPKIMKILPGNLRAVLRMDHSGYSKAG